MRGLWKDIGISFLMGMVVPGFLLNLGAAMLSHQDETLPVVESRQTEPVEQEQPQTPSELVALCRQQDNAVVKMEMDEYLTGVVLAEMPAYFEEEALKAQSVVARTYAQKAFHTGGKHKDGSVCTNSGCCQAYISAEDYLTRGGSEEDVETVRRCVSATSGYVLTYQGELIEATYFSCSGGSTEDAVAVWGTDFPYLRAVDSPGEEHAAYYRDTVHFTAEAFQKKMNLSLEGDPVHWFGPTTKTSGGGVATILIGGQTYTGTQLRSILGLKSTAFDVDVGAGGITITTQGFGHRVGMSQYGADAMALSGHDYPEILAHYYPGTVLQWLAE